MINNRTILSVAISLLIISISLVMGYGLLSHAQEPESTKDISANDLMWDFFQRHPRSKGPNQSTKD